MSKRTITILLSMVMLFGTNVFAQEQVSGNMNFDFASNNSGFVPIFADYPNDKDADQFYELDYGWKEIPVEKAGKGLFISGNNHSDDLFMGYYKELDGFTPNDTYTVEVSFQLATDADGGMIGIGGSPGSSVYVKCGITPQKPAVTVGDLHDYRLNIDKGNQAMDGKDMAMVGTIEKHETLEPGKYELNDYNATLKMTANQEGKAYLIIGTDSGFEGTTSYYISNISLKWNTYNDRLEQDEENISVFVKGVQVDFSKYDNVMPVIENDRTLVPVRAVSEALSADVIWYGDVKQIEIKKDNTLIHKMIGNSKAYVNGVEKQLDVVPDIRNDRTLVPLRFIAESLNLDVQWDGDSRTITIE